MTFALVFCLALYLLGWYIDYRGSTNARALGYGEESPLMRDSGGKLVIWKLHVVKAVQLLLVGAVIVIAARYDMGSAVVLAAITSGVSFLVAYAAVRSFL